MMEFDHLLIHFHPASQGRFSTSGLNPMNVLNIFLFNGRAKGSTGRTPNSARIASTLSSRIRPSSAGVLGNCGIPMPVSGLINGVRGSETFDK